MPRRIAMVTHEFPKLSETFLVSKALGLLEAGWDVQVVCGRRDDEAWSHFPGAEEALRERVHGPRRSLATRRGRLAAPWGALRALTTRPSRSVRVLRGSGGGVQGLAHGASLLRVRPDLVHFEFGPLALAYGATARALDVPFVASFRGYDLNYVGLDDPGFYEPVWRRSAAVHVLGQDLLRRAHARGCPSTKRIAIIPPALDPSPFAARTHTDGSPLEILSVGRLEWKKGYEFAIDTIRRVVAERPDVRYRIVGDGAHAEAVAYAAADMGVQEQVVSLGPRPPAEVRALLAETDVFLHMAVSEGFCNAVLEAQAAGVPVVCSDADGLAENVADGETGFVVPRRDPAAAAARVLELGGDAELRTRMGTAGRSRVEAHFRIEDQIAAFDRLYREVLDLKAR